MIAANRPKEALAEYYRMVPAAKVGQKIPVGGQGRLFNCRKPYGKMDDAAWQAIRARSSCF
jgi:hypothetical protein